MRKGLRILIVGATSGIAVEVARMYASAGAVFFLVARNEARLERVAADLRVRGAAAATMVMDVDDLARHGEMLARATEAMAGIDVALIAHGTLPDQARCEESAAETVAALRTNALSTVALLTDLGALFEQRGAGSIAVISSVAGDRGRKSNYVYGAAKATVDAFAQGLRNRLHAANVHVLTIKPGFTATPMTRHLPPSPLFSSARRVAGGIVSGIENRRDVIYVPWFWRSVMLVIRAIPERLFKRMSL